MGSKSIIVCMGESKGGQIYKFCLDFHHFSKWHSGVYVEFSLLEMWWFDDFFLIWLAHMYSFFCLQFYTTVKQSIMFCLILFFYRTNISFSFCNYHNIPQVEVVFFVFLFALSLIINCMVIIVCIIIQFANAILHSRYILSLKAFTKHT